MLNFYIPHRQPGETIEVLMRRHWFTITAKMAFWTFVGFMPMLLYIVLGDLITTSPDLLQFYPIAVLFFSVYYLFVWLFGLTAFLDYFLDVWIITDRRIIDIEQKALFSRTVSELELHRVQDVTAEVKGFFPTMFDYGNVYIQTAAEKERFIFKQIPNPNSSAADVMRRVQAIKRAHPELRVE